MFISRFQPERKMGELHFFQRYSQYENVTTNNVLRLLQTIHQQRRGKLEMVLAGLAENSAGTGRALEVGPRFLQQVRGPLRVADGIIRQQGFDVLIETKLGDKFDPDQAIGHLEQIRSSANPTLLLLSSNVRKTDSSLDAIIKAAASMQPPVRVLACTFKDIVDQCRSIISPHDDELVAILDDFEDYCLGAGLISTDEYTMFVPPCGESYEENIAYRLYYCPASRSRRNGRWLGIYYWKCVRAVGRIEHVLDVSQQGDETLTPGASPDVRQRILDAIDGAMKRGWDLLLQPHTFYVCSDLALTEFHKDSPGGIPGHRYFDLRRLEFDKNEAMTSAALAQKLASRRWSEWNQS